MRGILKSRNSACGTHNALQDHRSWLVTHSSAVSPNDGCRRSVSRVAALVCFHPCLGVRRTRGDPQHAPYTSGPSTDPSSDDSIPLFLSDLQGQPDPQELAPFAASQRTSILTRVVAGGLAVFAFAILVAVINSDVTRVLAVNSDVTRFLIDKARAPMGGTTRDQSATQAASNQPAARQILLNDDPARASDPMTRASVNTSAPHTESCEERDSPG